MERQHLLIGPFLMLFTTVYHVTIMSSNSQFLFSNVFSFCLFHCVVCVSRFSPHQKQSQFQGVNIHGAQSAIRRSNTPTHAVSALRTQQFNHEIHCMKSFQNHTRKGVKYVCKCIQNFFTSRNLSCFFFNQLQCHVLNQPSKSDVLLYCRIIQYLRMHNHRLHYNTSVLG